MAPRISPHAPTHCAACFGQYVDRTFVDFQASYDGPVIEGGVIGEDGEVKQRIPVTIDDLVLCDGCVKDAAVLIGMVADDGTKDALLEANRNLSEQLAGQRDYAASLERTLAAKPEQPKPASKPQARKKVPAPA